MPRRGGGRPARHPRPRAGLRPRRPGGGAPPGPGRRRRVAARGAPRRHRGAHVGHRDGLDGPPPAPPAAEPGRPALRRRAGGLAAADRVGHGRRPRAGDALRPPARRAPATSVALRRSAAVGLPAPLLERERPPAPRRRRRLRRAGRRDRRAWSSSTTSSTHPVPDRLPRGGGPRRASGASGRRRSSAPAACSAPCRATARRWAGPTPSGSSWPGSTSATPPSAIERERLLAEVSRRNRVLESLRAMLETLAGPDRVEGGLAASLLALSRALGAAAVGRPGRARRRARRSTSPATTSTGGRRRDDVAQARGGRPPSCSPAPTTPTAGARLVGRRPRRGDAAACPEGRAALVAHLPDAGLGGDTLELLDDASRSLALAMEAEALERAQREAAALRRSQAIQRELLSSLSHELRTPLTAIQGYASTLLPARPDLGRRRRPSGSCGRSPAESARLERLVGDLLDSTAIESGILRLQRGLVRRPPGGRGGDGAACTTAAPVRIHVDRRPGAGVGRPRPPGAGDRQPARERRAPTGAPTDGVDVTSAAGPAGHRRGRGPRPRRRASPAGGGRSHLRAPGARHHRRGRGRARAGRSPRASSRPTGAALEVTVPATAPRSCVTLPTEPAGRAPTLERRAGRRGGAPMSSDRTPACCWSRTTRTSSTSSGPT